MIEQARDKLIFALDVETMSEAKRWVRLLRGRIGLFKVGKQLFTRCGPDAVRMIQDGGGRVFLDLKYHDIPNTVAKACREAAELKVEMFTLHALGGSEMMLRTAAAVRELSDSCVEKRPVTLAVTILTSMNEKSLKEVGIGFSPAVIVPQLARLARNAGIDGVIASPLEILLIRKACGEDFLIVTPGVRPAGAAEEDQKRVATPYRAILAGADCLVIGRPISLASDPVATTEAIVEEMSRAFEDR